MFLQSGYKIEVKIKRSGNLVMIGKMGARLATNPLEIGCLCKRRKGNRDDGFSAEVYGIQDNRGHLISPIIIPSQVSRSYAAKKYSIEQFLMDESEI